MVQDAALAELMVEALTERKERGMELLELWMELL